MKSDRLLPRCFLFAVALGCSMGLGACQQDEPSSSGTDGGTADSQPDALDDKDAGQTGDAAAPDDSGSTDGGFSRDAQEPVGDASAPSWNEADPPVRDTAIADSYCAQALETFREMLPQYRDVDAPNADLATLYQMERMFHGAIAMYEVTKDESVLSGLLDVSLAIIAAGEDRNHDGYLDYCYRLDNHQVDTSQSPACDDDPAFMPTHPWRALRGPARVLRALRGTNLATSRAADVERLRAFLFHDLIDKWLDGDGPDKGQRGTNTVGITARIAAILNDYSFATGDASMRNRANGLIRQIIDNMRLSTSTPTAYVFDNRLGSEEEPADTSHANEIVDVLIDGFRSGYLPYSAIDPLQSTLLDVIWNQDSANPLFHWLVDGTTGGEPDKVYALPVGWMCLGQFRGATQDLMEKVRYSSGYELEAVEAQGVLCRNRALALTAYPLSH